MRIVFTWNVPPPVRALFRARLASDELVFPEDGYEAPDLIADADVAIGWRVTPEQLAAARALRLFQTPAAGADHLVPVLRTAAHVPLCNSHGNARTVAETALALILAQAKQVPYHDREMRAGRWRVWEEDRPSLILEGRTVGLIGFGAVNRRLAELVRGLGMRCRAVRRGGAGTEPVLDWVGAPAELPRLLSESDVAVVAAPLTPETRGLLGRAQLSAARPGSILVNVARGELLDEDALWEALTNGPLGGAAIDVWYEYHPAPDAEGRRYPYRRPFHTLPNVTLSPHRGASPLDDVTRWEDVLENVRRAGRGEPLRNRVELERGY